jgi:hypothetical protein
MNHSPKTPGSSRAFCNRLYDVEIRKVICSTNAIGYGAIGGRRVSDAERGSGERLRFWVGPFDAVHLTATAVADHNRLRPRFDVVGATDRKSSDEELLTRLLELLSVPVGSITTTV